MSDQEHYPEGGQRPPPAERIAYETIHLDGKTIYVDLKHNYRGYHLRITEESHGKRSAIVVPIEGMAPLAQYIVSLARRAEELSENED